MLVRFLSTELPGSSQILKYACVCYGNQAGAQAGFRRNWKQELACFCSLGYPSLFILVPLLALFSPDRAGWLSLLPSPWVKEPPLSTDSRFSCPSTGKSSHSEAWPLLFPNFKFLGLHWPSSGQVFGSGPISCDEGWDFIIPRW